MDYSYLKDMYESISLLFQGGGALGSYQAGVYEGIYRHKIPIDIVGGVSIGAINAAIIAGNPIDERVDKLRSFWNTIIQRNVTSKYVNPYRASFRFINELREQPFFQMLCPMIHEDSLMMTNLRMLEGLTDVYLSMLEGQQGFYTPRYSIPYGETPDKMSFYSTNKLYETLESHVDLTRLNDPDHLKICVAACNVETGHYVRFANWQQEITFDHIVASASLPPAFPAVKIGNSYYWDGGLVSNTPLTILDENPEKMHLILQVDLWNSRGVLPTNMVDVAERAEEIQHASKTRMFTDLMGNNMQYNNLISDLLNMVPPKQRTQELIERCEAFKKNHVVNIIELIYKREKNAHAFREYDFGDWYTFRHWQEGLNDLNQTCEHPEWFEVPDESQPFVNHDIHVYNRNLEKKRKNTIEASSSKLDTDDIKLTTQRKHRKIKRSTIEIKDSKTKKTASSSKTKEESKTGSSTKTSNASSAKKVVKEPTKSATKTSAKTATQSTSKTEKKVASKSTEKALTKTVVKSSAKTLAKDVAKPDTKTVAKPTAKPSTKVIVKVATKPATKMATKIETKTVSKPAPKSVAKAEDKTVEKSASKTSEKTNAKTGAQVATKEVSKPDQKTATKSLAKTELKSTLKNAEKSLKSTQVDKASLVAKEANKEKKDSTSQKAETVEVKVATKPTVKDVAKPASLVEEKSQTKLSTTFEEKCSKSSVTESLKKTEMKKNDSTKSTSETKIQEEPKKVEPKKEELTQTKSEKTTDKKSEETTKSSQSVQAIIDEIPKVTFGGNLLHLPKPSEIAKAKEAAKKDDSSEAVDIEKSVSSKSTQATQEADKKNDAYEVKLPKDDSKDSK